MMRFPTTRHYPATKQRIMSANDSRQGTPRLGGHAASQHPGTQGAAGVLSLCHVPTVPAKGTGFPSGHPSGLTAPLLPQAALVRLGPLALGAVRHRPVRGALRDPIFLRSRAKNCRGHPWPVKHCTQWPRKYWITWDFRFFRCAGATSHTSLAGL